jgi:hypothetical protein
LRNVYQATLIRDFQWRKKKAKDDKKKGKGKQAGKGGAGREDESQLGNCTT